MLVMAMTAVSNWFKGAWAWIALAAAVVVAFLATYAKGKQDERVQQRVEVLEEDAKNVREAQEVRNDVAGAGDDELSVRVRRWTVERH